MVENNANSKTELFAITDEQKKAGKKIFQILFYLAQRKQWVTYLKDGGRWGTSKKVFYSKQTWKWFMSILIGDVKRLLYSGEWLNCALEILQENNIYLSSIFQYCSPYS